MFMPFGQIDTQTNRWVKPKADLLRMLDYLPEAYQKQALQTWTEKANKSNRGTIERQRADDWLRNLLAPFVNLPKGLAGIDLSASDEDITGLAQRAATAFFSYERIGYPSAALVSRAAEEYGISPDIFTGKEKDGILGRLKDEKFWRRQLRKNIGRMSETAVREIGGVSRKTGLYASNEALLRRLSQKRRNSGLLKTMQAINELGQDFTLEELSALGVSNPEIRRAELMVRIRGFEEIAKLKNHVGEFFTITAPSRFHKMHHWGKPNEKFSGETPRETAQYLNKVWARIRAELGRLEIRFYGFRVAEPHHDGTPHWHGLVFLEEEHRDTFRRVVAKHACRENREELGLNYFVTAKEIDAEARCRREKLLKETGSSPTLKAIRATLKTESRFWAKKSFKFWKQSPAKARVDFEPINWARGTAAGYIAKYIAKNIDGKNHNGESVGMDFESEEYLSTAETAQRVDAWAATWGIRQFQQLGGAPVTVWRELRRIVPTASDDVLMLAQQAADMGDWARFTILLGGEVVKRADLTLGLYKDETEETNKYGETIAPRVMGVYEKATGEVAISRIHTWTIQKIGGIAAAWTRVNNCTKINKPSEMLEKLGEIAQATSKKEFSDGIDEAEFKEWAMWKHGASAGQLHYWQKTDELAAQFAQDKALLEALEETRSPFSSELIEKIRRPYAEKAEKNAKKSKDLSIYRDYIAQLERISRPLVSGLTPAEPKFNISEFKTAKKPQRIILGGETVESAIAKARQAMAETEKLNDKLLGWS